VTSITLFEFDQKIIGLVGTYLGITAFDFTLAQNNVTPICSLNLDIL
jgi:hypothetical protein